MKPRERNNVALGKRARAPAQTQNVHLGCGDNPNVPTCMIDDRSEELRRDVTERLAAARRASAPKMTPGTIKLIQTDATRVQGVPGDSQHGQTQSMPEKSTETHSLERFVPVITGAGWVPWPEKSDLLCWHCCHAFEATPVPAITHVDERRHIMQVTGNFCGWECAKAWMIDNGMNAQICHLRRLSMSKEPIRKAPPRTSLKAFGGALSIEEFRANRLHWCDVSLRFDIQLKHMAHWGFKPKSPTAQKKHQEDAQTLQTTDPTPPPMPAQPSRGASRLSEGLVRQKPPRASTIDKYF
jgi:hypothetical protein